MSGKFMKIRKIVIPTITMLIIASQLCGCAAASSQELLDMLNRQESIVIEVAEPISQEQGTQNQLEWVELASLTTYPTFRDTVDDLLNITAHGVNGKNGILYVDLESNHTNNSTMYFAFSNQKFIDKAWNNSETLPKLLEATKAIYADVETDAVAKVAFLNAYFNILPDAEPNYFNGGQTLTRAEYLAAVYRAGAPVSTLETDVEFTSLVDPLGTNENTAFANQIADYSYLTIADESLNDKTFDCTISRAEAIYTIVRMYYNAEYESLTGKEASFSDIKNGGDILEKAGKKYLKENETTADAVKFGKSYELNYMLQNPDKGVTPELYKAMVLAKTHGLITGTECRWDEAITKGELLHILSRLFEDLGTTTNADRGASAGEVVEKPIEDETHSSEIELEQTINDTDTQYQDGYEGELNIESTETEEPSKQEDTSNKLNLTEEEKQTCRDMFGLTDEQIENLTEAELDRIIKEWAEEQVNGSGSSSGGSGSSGGSSGDGGDNTDDSEYDLPITELVPGTVEGSM